MIPKKREYQKPYLVVNIIYVGNLSSRKIQGSVSSSRSQSEPYTCTSVLHLKVGGFVFRVVILIVRNFWKLPSFLIHLNNQTVFSSATTGLISSIKVSIENFYLVAEHSTEKIVEFDLCIRMVRIQNFRKVLLKTLKLGVRFHNYP